MTRLKVFTLISIIFTSTAFAAKPTWAGFGGLNFTEYDGSGVNFDRELGFEFGGTAYYAWKKGMTFRTGVGYVQKNSSAGSLDLEFSYLEVPVTILYWTQKNFGFIGGANVDLNISDDCEPGCTIDDSETLVINLVLGAHFKLDQKSAFEALMEFIPLTDIANDTEIGNSLSARYLHFF